MRPKLGDECGAWALSAAATSHLLRIPFPLVAFLTARYAMNVLCCCFAEEGRNAAEENRGAASVVIATRGPLASPVVSHISQIYRHLGRGVDIQDAALVGVQTRLAQQVVEERDGFIV
jgi:hypothetical protein